MGQNILLQGIISVPKFLTSFDWLPKNNIKTLYNPSKYLDINPRKHLGNYGLPCLYYQKSP